MLTKAVWRKTPMFMENRDESGAKVTEERRVHPEKTFDCKDVIFAGMYICVIAVQPMKALASTTVTDSGIGALFNRVHDPKQFNGILINFGGSTMVVMVHWAKQESGRRVIVLLGEKTIVPTFNPVNAPVIFVTELPMSNWITFLVLVSLMRSVIWPGPMVAPSILMYPSNAPLVVNVPLTESNV
jgi:hypothetical protein